MRFKMENDNAAALRTDLAGYIRIDAYLRDVIRGRTRYMPDSLSVRSSVTGTRILIAGGKVTADAEDAVTAVEQIPRQNLIVTDNRLAFHADMVTNSLAVGLQGVKPLYASEIMEIRGTQNIKNKENNV